MMFGSAGNLVRDVKSIDSDGEGKDAKVNEPNQLIEEEFERMMEIYIC